MKRWQGVIADFAKANVPDWERKIS